MKKKHLILAFSLVFGMVAVAFSHSKKYEVRASAPNHIIYNDEFSNADPTIPNQAEAIYRVSHFFVNNAPFSSSGFVERHGSYQYRFMPDADSIEGITPQCFGVDRLADLVEGKRYVMTLGLDFSEAGEGAKFIFESQFGAPHFGFSIINGSAPSSYGGNERNLSYDYTKHEAKLTFVYSSNNGFFVAYACQYKQNYPFYLTGLKIEEDPNAWSYDFLPYSAGTTINDNVFSVWNENFLESEMTVQIDGEGTHYLDFVAAKPDHERFGGWFINRLNEKPALLSGTWYRFTFHFLSQNFDALFIHYGGGVLNYTNDSYSNTTNDNDYLNGGTFDGTTLTADVQLNQAVDPVWWPQLWIQFKHSNSLSVKIDAITATLIPVDDAYEYARGFLDATAVCDPSGNVDNITSELWLARQSSFEALGSESKALLAGTAPKEKGNLLEQCIARYAYIVNKYGKNNFMNRSDVSPSFSSIKENHYEDNEIVIIVLLVASFVGIIVATPLRKKRKS